MGDYVDVIKINMVARGKLEPNNAVFPANRPFPNTVAHKNSLTFAKQIFNAQRKVHVTRKNLKDA